jgi:hypothetical protein
MSGRFAATPLLRHIRSSRRLALREYRQGVPSEGDNADDIRVPAWKRRPRILRTNPFEAPDAAGQITYADGLISRPIEGPYVPVVSAEEALRRALEIGFKPALQPGVPTVVLRSVSVGFDTSAAAFAPHPAWVIIWHGSKPRLHGPRAPSPEHEARRADVQARMRCIYIVVVDATTAEPQDVRKICR